MPTSESFLGLSGSGQTAFSSPTAVPIGVVVDVTSLGFAEALEVTTPPRYLKIGWIALWDIWAGDPNVPDGDYFHEPVFIWFQRQWIERVFRLDATTGTSGFAYALQPGVVADFYWWF